MARLAATSSGTVRYLYQPNQGAAAARNTGIREARGELLAFLDSDDWWLPGKLQLQAAALAANPGVLIAHTREIWFRDGQRVNQKKKHDPPHGDIFAASLGMCVVGMSTVVARRELFDRSGGFDETFTPGYGEDVDLAIRVWQAHHRVVCDPSIVVEHYEYASYSSGRPPAAASAPPPS